MKRDPELLSVLESASDEDLEPILELLTGKGFGFKVKDKWSAKKLRKKIEEELRRNGGNSFANAYRGYGPEWEEIVRDVADKLNVEYEQDDSTEEVERSVAVQVLERAVDNMSATQRSRLLQNLEAEGMPRNLPVGQGALAAALVGGRVAGFASYKILVIVANAVAKTLIGKGLTYATNAALTKLLSVALGPVGWALTAVWTAIDLAGPAARITVPSVVMIGVLRAQQEST
jgi:uncharacterized protein YaaW (UPF0174 family)